MTPRLRKEMLLFTFCKKVLVAQIVGSLSAGFLLRKSLSDIRGRRGAVSNRPAHSVVETQLPARPSAARFTAAPPPPTPLHSLWRFPLCGTVLLALCLLQRVNLSLHSSDQHRHYAPQLLTLTLVQGRVLYVGLTDDANLMMLRALYHSSGEL